MDLVSFPQIFSEADSDTSERTTEALGLFLFGLMPGEKIWKNLLVNVVNGG